MKSFFKIILQYYLKYITKLVLFIHQPIVIAVAGSTNKTFARDEIKKILLASGKSVRANPRNFNTEIGLPLAILNIRSGYNSYRDWLPVIAAAFAAIFQKNFPEYLVLELGVSRRGDMKYLLSIVNPKISVITDITQRYLEAFSDMDGLVGEYAYLVKNTKKDGVVILNYDNFRVRVLSEKAKARVEYFGKGAGAVWKISEITKTEKGQMIKVEHQNKIQNYSSARFGEHHAYALTAALAAEEALEK
ncbi:MAG: Mur ligase family protein [Candidatus Pacebacteria bacterium]|nr:Mur ligase family protein [Candidatus Paceibacterota bacterium]MDR3582901.1 Mur ligase family protein [Candidatus Paceibacterota bacterium]